MATPRLSTSLDAAITEALTLGATHATVIAELSEQILRIARYVDRPSKVARRRRRLLPPLAGTGGLPAQNKESTMIAPPEGSAYTGSRPLAGAKRDTTEG